MINFGDVVDTPPPAWAQLELIDLVLLVAVALVVVVALVSTI